MEPVPPHSHKLDRISEIDLIPDPTVLAALPSSAEEGRFAIIESGGSFSLYRFIKGAWVLIGPVTLSTITGTLAISKGGTGQTTATAAFTALSPTTTKGDLIVDNGTDPIRLAVGANGKILSANSAQASGLEWIDLPDTDAIIKTLAITGSFTVGDLIVDVPAATGVNLYRVTVPIPLKAATHSGVSGHP